MAKFFDSMSDHIQDFIRAQHLFFVATAPLSGEGHVNVSPKGLDCFRILSPNKVAYLDITGSGNETSAHTHENGRITLMFCAFDGPPNIVRLFGKGRTVLPDTPEWDNMIGGFTPQLGMRQVIVGDIDMVQTSCGYSVPFFDYVGERDTWEKWAENKGEEGLLAYRAEKNSCSLDSLPTPMALKVTE